MAKTDDWSDLEDWAEEEITNQFISVRKKIVHNFMESVTRPSPKGDWTEGYTPVDSGTLMANTFLTLNNPSDTKLSATDSSGSNTYTRAMNKLSQAKGFEDVYIQNNIEYASLADTVGWRDGDGRMFAAPYMFWKNAITYTISEMESSE